MCECDVSVVGLGVGGGCESVAVEMGAGAGADEAGGADAGVEDESVGVVPATAAAAAAAYRIAGRGAAAGGRADAAAVGLEGSPALRAEDMGWVAKLGDGTGGGLGASAFDSSVVFRTGVFFVCGLVVVSSVDGLRARAPLLVDDSSSWLLWLLTECFLAGVARIGSE